MRALRILGASSACLFAAALSAQTVKTVISNGSTETRYDIVILGDGYQLTEEAQFDADVTAIGSGVFVKVPYQSFSAF